MFPGMSLAIDGTCFKLEASQRIQCQGFTLIIQTVGVKEVTFSIEGTLVYPFRSVHNQVCLHILEELRELRQNLAELGSCEEGATDILHRVAVYERGLAALPSAHPDFVVDVHAIVVVDRHRPYHVTFLHDPSLHFEVCADEEPPDDTCAPTPLTLAMQVTQAKDFSATLFTLFKEWAVVACSTLGYSNHSTLDGNSSLPWAVVPRGNGAQFKQGYLYVLQDETTQRYDLRGPDTSFRLKGRLVRVSWCAAEGRFSVSTEHQGVIPLIAAAKEEARARYDVQSLESLQIQGALPKSTAGVKTGELTPETLESLQLVRQQFNEHFAEFQAMPSGQGSITSTWPMVFDQAVVVKLAVKQDGQNLKVPFTMVIKDKAAPPVDSLERASNARVTRSFKLHRPELSPKEPQESGQKFPNGISKGLSKGSSKERTKPRHSPY
jgi:hypothetical protein